MKYHNQQDELLVVVCGSGPTLNGKVLAEQASLRLLSTLSSQT